MIHVSLPLNTEQTIANYKKGKIIFSCINKYRESIKIYRNILRVILKYVNFLWVTSSDPLAHCIANTIQLCIWLRAAVHADGSVALRSSPGCDRCFGKEPVLVCGRIGKCLKM